MQYKMIIKCRRCVSYICFWFNVNFALSGYQAINGSRSLGLQSARRILDHVGHDECTLQEHTEIAAHILKHGSCYIVGCLAQAKSCQAVRLQCISFISHRLDWVPSVLTRRGADDIAGHPRLETHNGQVTFVKSWMCFIAKSQYLKWRKFKSSSLDELFFFFFFHNPYT